MPTTIELRLFSGLQKFKPASSEIYPIEQGTTIRELLKEIDLPEKKINLLFINGIKANLDSSLQGGERVGIFPPLGGG